MIRAEALTVAAGDFKLASVNFHVPAGAYCALMGRTGSGKTTLLETICGLKRPLGGTLHLDGCDASQLPPAARQIGFVPQDGALFQTMTVRRHLAFALTVRGWSAAKVRQRVEALAELIEVTDLLDRKPQGLSGGEAQRVALGRALAFSPRLLCLDEPLSSLDDDSHEHLIEVLTRVHRETGVTALHVTHNRREAAELADMLLVVEEGTIREAPLSVPSDADRQPGIYQP